MEEKKKYMKIWYEKNKEKILEYQKNYYNKNKEKVLNRNKKYKKQWDKKNLDKIIIYRKKNGLDYRLKNKEKIKKYNRLYTKNRYNNDIIFKIKLNCRNRIHSYIKKNNIYKTSTTFKIIGCTPLELKQHLENQFQKGMNWDNYGGWHIDHIIPLSSANTKKELYKLCHYSNLQPLWAIDNIKKGGIKNEIYA